MKHDRASIETNVRRDLTPCEAARALAGLRVIDVREPEEFHGDLGHLPGATLLPLRELATAASWPRSEPLLVVCRSGRRSAEACAPLGALGFSDVSNLHGGLIAWAERGLPLCGAHHRTHHCGAAPDALALEEAC
jgi:rhodanese-related sulfurtransferase